MLSSLKERVHLLSSKTIEQYYGVLFMPSFNNIEIYKNATNVGIPVSDYNLVLSKLKNKHSIEINRSIQKLINYINSVVFDKEFIQKTINKIIFVANYGNFECNIKSFVGSVIINNKEYKFALKIDLTSISFATEYAFTTLHGEFKIEPDAVKIKYNEKQQNKTYHELAIYDKYGNQNFNYIKDVKNNITTKEYIHKCPHNSIIKKKEVNNDDKYLIGVNHSPNNKKLPKNVVFSNFDKKLYNDYLTGKCDIQTIWDNAKSNHLSKNIYFID